MLWGRAAARCEMCNKPVSWHALTKESQNLGEAAHIVGFSKDGPRGEKHLSAELAKSIHNLMMLCRDCHKLVDSRAKTYTNARLRAMKREHENRVELVTAIERNRTTELVLYGANIGEQAVTITYDDAAAAVLDAARYPASREAVALGMVNSSFRDRTATFWKIESEHLQEMVQRELYPSLRRGTAGHISLFGLAPQPLLTLLGYLICDVNYSVETFQLHREPPGWSWTDGPTDTPYRLLEPAHGGIPALVLALSATIADDRVEAVLGEETAVWRVTIDEPQNDFLRSADQLAGFRQVVRSTLDRIKSKHGQGTPIHVFPAMPVSAAIELGRVLQPKADNALRMYDQNSDRGGFVHALDINMPKGEQS